MEKKIFPNWDCLNANNFAPGSQATEVQRDPGPPARPHCFLRQNFPWKGNEGRFFQIHANDYRR